MLTDEETAAFLALLLAFATETGASGRNLSAIFNVTGKTMARWLRSARGVDGKVRMYHSRVDHIERAIYLMNAANNKPTAGMRPYSKIARIAEPSKKLAALQAFMEANVR